ncbi:MAG: hypothetical protein ACTFAL_05530 [Candidatus Electronema sp. V4]|uniref:hypothetical protein n=1 Tax=Candidatus Electronema sp. V4 TaxID=3454756 RepID=UPI0040556A08
MKNLKLKSILLVSHRERRARKIEFHPQVTVIKGENDTGKSSLIKSILLAFGAEPHNIHHRWKDADVLLLVNFEIDGIEYSIYRHRDSFSLFDKQQAHIGRYSSVTNELAPALGKLFNFKLRLVDRYNKSLIPPPSYLLLPFYIDQDKGWTSTWNSFQRLGQFCDWKQRVISYHFGIKPDKWYELDARKKNLSSSMDEPQRQYNTIKNLKDETRDKISRVDFDIDIISFENEIDSLIEECNELKLYENSYRSSMSELKTEKIRIQAQIEIVVQTHDELSQDYKFAIESLGNFVVCPTCGSHHENSFAERFSIANDTETCVDLLSSLKDDLSRVDEEIKSVNELLNRSIEKQHSINSILSKKQGRVKLNDLIKIEGKRELYKHINAKLLNYEGIIEGISNDIKKIEEDMDGYVDKNRKDEIIKSY